MTDLQVSGAQRRNYYASIQVLRGVAALLVVLYHLVDAERIYGKGNLLLAGICRFGFAGVDVFFVISGFVMTTIAAGSYQSPTNAVTFLARRAVRILPLYWLFTTIIVVMMVAVPRSLDASFHAKSILASYLLWPVGTLPLLQVGWTLTYEAFFYVMMAMAIAFVPETRISAGWCAWSLAVLALQFLPVTSPAATVITSPMAWEFIAGAGAGIFARRVNAKLGRVAFWTGVIAMCMAVVAFNHLQLADQEAMRRTLCFGSTSALIVLGLAAREYTRASRPHRLLNAVGNASYSIYLTHLFVITVAARLWARTGLNTATSGHIGFVMATVAITTLAGCACFAFVERPLLKLGSRFIGRSASTAQAQPA